MARYLLTPAFDENLVLNEEETEVVQTFRKYTFAQIVCNACTVEICIII